MAKSLRRRRAPKKRSTSKSRFAALALGVGIAIVLVFALVFSIAYGTKNIATHAEALHDADEALRSATVLRAQAGLSAHLQSLDVQLGFDTSESVDKSMREVSVALTDFRESIAELTTAAGESSDEISAAALAFATVVESISDSLAAADTEAAAGLAARTLDATFREVIDTVVPERNAQAAAVAAASALMGRVGDIARFLVAFLVPTAVIFIYRELTRRSERAKELEVRLEAEKELGQAREEFVANASHELRTPLTSIFGLAHVLEEEPSIVENEVALEMVNMIISEANDLSRMVDDLLTTARLDAGAIHYTFEELAILDEVHEVTGPMGRGELNIDVEVQPALVRSDRLRFRQVLRNLVSNAGKYGGPKIRVSGRVVSGWYQLTVADNGDGIPGELEEKLFQRFLHKGTQPIILGSVGLGLSIVRALAEGMGGAVWYERTEGWTRFIVRIPLVELPVSSAVQDPGKPGRAALQGPGGTLDVDYDELAALRSIATD